MPFCSDAKICRDVGRAPLAVTYLGVGLGIVAAVLFVRLALWMYNKFVIQERIQQKKDYERLYGDDDNVDEQAENLLKKIQDEERTLFLQNWILLLYTPENRSGNIVVSHTVLIY